MRLLKFNVNKHTITMNPKSDFGSVIPKTTEEIIADFTFSSDWDDTIKVAAFYNSQGECPPQELIDGMYCKIPEEALNGYWFRVQILGYKQGRTKVTNQLDVIQNRR